MDLMRRKDQELQKMRQDYETLLHKSEETEVGLKKKHQEIINEMNEQIDHLTKQRNRWVGYGWFIRVILFVSIGSRLILFKILIKNR